MTKKIELIQGDCMEYLPKFPDNHFDLLIADVNYGIGMMDSDNKSRGKLAKAKDYKKIDDSKPPDPYYFDLVKRKSKNQIFWGANHFLDSMPFNINSSCWIIWDKVNGNNDFADCEIAWTSFKSAVRLYRFRWNGMLKDNNGDNDERHHPAQKPVALYKWLLKNYAKEGDTILDTHFGSLSIGIACGDMGFELTAFEIDKDYYSDAVKRLKNHLSQQDFTREPFELITKSNIDIK